MKDQELILIRITGEDRPGLTAGITSVLAKYKVDILDIGQADIHNTLSLGILFKSKEADSGFIMKELLFKASTLNVQINFTPITIDGYNEWVSMQGKNRYILTLLGRSITAPEIAAIIVDGVDGKVDAMLTVPIKKDGYLAIFPPVAGG